MSAKKQIHSLNFEESLAELGEIVKHMEQGERSLEDMLKDFERGMALSQQCNKSLASARQRVEKLIANNGEPTLQPLEDTQGDE